MTSKLFKFTAGAVLTATIGVFSSGSLAAEYHFDAAKGDDNLGNGSALKPWKSVNKAFTTLKAGDVGLFRTGNYGDVTISGTSALYSNWVTLKAAPGESPSIGALTAKANMPAGEKKLLNLIFDGIDIKGGVNTLNIQNLQIKNNTIEVPGPWTGSNDNIEKNALFLRASTNITVDNADITRTGIGATLYQTDEITIKNSVIHDITHDGIRVIGTRNTLIENNHIYGLNDGVTDAEADWSRHCDAIHVYIAGASSAALLRPNDGVIIRGNTLHDVEAQLLQFNNINEYNAPEHWNRNVLFEHNVFGPSVAPMAFNNASPVVGLIFRHNVFANYESKYTSPYAEVKTKTIVSKSSSFRTSPETTGLQVYNNVFFDNPGIAGEADIYDYNIIQAPKSGAALPRNTKVVATADLFQLPINLLSSPKLKLATNSKVIGAGYNFDTGIAAPVLTNVKPNIGAYDITNAPLTTKVFAISDSVLAVTSSVLPIPSLYDLNSESGVSLLSSSLTDIKSYFEDFEDANLDEDHVISDGSRLGIRWAEAELTDSHFGIESSTVYSRNMLHTPLLPDNKVNTLLADVDVDWSKFILSFDAMSTYVKNGSGPAFLYIDKNNYYFLDIGSEAGNLIRVMGGKKTILASNMKVALPQKEMAGYRVVISKTASAISFEIDSDDDGVADLKYSDTDKTAIAIYTTGKVGFLHELEEKYFRVNYDNVSISRTEKPLPPKAIKLEVIKAR